MDADRIDRILEKHGYRHSAIIGILQDVQNLENYLSEEALRYVSEKLGLRLTRIYDVATFYTGFSLLPKGRHVIKVCCGTPCHLAGSVDNMEEIKRKLHLKEGETTADGSFTLEIVNCPGNCALAPLVMVDEDYYENVDIGQVEDILASYDREPERSKIEKG